MISTLPQTCINVSEKEEVSYNTRQTHHLLRNGCNIKALPPLESGLKDHDQIIPGRQSHPISHADRTVLASFWLNGGGEGGKL